MNQTELIRLILVVIAVGIAYLVHWLAAVYQLDAPAMQELYKDYPLYLLPW